MFFILSKIFWALAQPLNALCLLALIGLAVRLRFKKTGQGIMNASLCLILIFAIVPFGLCSLVWLETRYPLGSSETLPKRVDGVIVLGGAFESYLSHVSGQVSTNEQADRLLCFADIARHHPEAKKLVFSGGSGDLQHPDTLETNDARAYFDLTGFKRPVIYEDRSRSTYENALYSKELANPQSGENWVMVTSAFHVPRAMGVFEQQGWAVIPYPCDPKTEGAVNLKALIPNATANYYLLNLALKELIGGIAYYLTGKSASVFSLEPAKSLL